MKFTAGILRSIIGLGLSGSFLFYGCQKTKEHDEGAANDPSLDNIVFEVPDAWPVPVYSFAENQLTREGFALGGALFFEPMLSADNKVSCGSCHQRHYSAPR